MTSPISQKVLAATAGSGIGAAASVFVTWVLGVLAWGAPGDAEHVSAALAAVPSPVTLLLAAVLAVVGAFVPGFAVTDPLRKDPDAAPYEPGDYVPERASELTAAGA